MRAYYHKPENALKRAEELIAVNQPAPALTLLHDVIMSKKARGTPLDVLEPIMTRFVDLCVAERKGKVVREGLHQFKNMTQNITVSGIENVIKHFINLAETKVAEAQAKAEKITLDAIEDLEEYETPESIILSTVSAEGDKERTDREVVTPWVKFLWESYRIALDILRNNTRLEVLYQTIANQAFQFCLKYTRKTEFRRLCELLRQHLATAAKYAHQSYSINLSDPETLQRQLDTRFIQLNAAADLELWQEAFRSVEDIYNLMGMSKKQAKPFMMANYFDKLSKIFLVGENYLFHAAAMNKHFGVTLAHKNMSAEEIEKKTKSTIARNASLAILSALAIPIISYTRVDPDENKAKMQRLTNLVKMTKKPTRDGLLRDAIAKNLLPRAAKPVAELYNALEIKVHPLQICKKVEPIMKYLGEVPEFTKYIKPLREVIVTRVLQQLSQVYNTIQVSTVISLCHFPEPYSLSAHQIEKFIMNTSKKGDLNIYVDHRTRSLTFERDIFAVNSTSDDGEENDNLSATNGSQIMEKMKQQLRILAGKLQSTVLLIKPEIAQQAAARRAELLKSAVAHSAEDHAAALERLQISEKKKFDRENEAARLAKEEQQKRMKKIAEEQAAEKARLAEEQKRREMEKMEQMRKEMMAKEQKRVAEDLANRIGVDLKKVKLEEMDSEKLREFQMKEMTRAETEKANKIKTIAKRYDYLERAFRKEEIPLLAKDYEMQKKTDHEAYLADKAATLENHKKQYERGMAFKKNLLRMLEDYQVVKDELLTRREAELKVKREEAAKKIEAAKEKRRQDVKAKKEEERRRRIEEMRRSKEREEEEARRRAEEEERRTQEQSEYSARKAKLDELERRKLDREREIEERLSRRRLGDEESPAPSRSEESSSWRRREEPPAAEVPSNPGKYVPPVRRGATMDRSGSDMSGSDRDMDRGASNDWRRRDGSGPEKPPPFVPPARRTYSDRPMSGSSEGAWRRSDSGDASSRTEGSWKRSTDDLGAGKKTEEPVSRGPPRIGAGSWRERMAAKKAAEEAGQRQE